GAKQSLGSADAMSQSATAPPAPPSSPVPPLPPPPNAVSLSGGGLAVYYLPEGDVRKDLLELTDRRTRCPFKGDASYWSVRAGGRVAVDAVWGYERPLDHAPPLAGHRAFCWERMDHWFEEDEEVFVHPRDPYTRIDVLSSSRHVRVLWGGEVLADSLRPRILFETGLPARYYLPAQDVRAGLLTPTPTLTRCPYKGLASYWSARVGGGGGA
ncbi:MAG: DUF427 domain-containing protein, partial [Egibacteraceae bacterium]